MKRNRKKVTIAACIGIMGVGMLSFNRGDDRSFQIIKNLDIFNAAYRELDMFYVDTIDPKKVIRDGIEGMFMQTDPYTEYYPEDDNTIKEMTTGKFGGIGSYIRYYKARDRVVVSEPNEDSPAAKSGLRAGDLIMTVDGKEMRRGKDSPQEYLNKVSKSLRGEPGTVCMVRVERPTLDGKGEIKEFKITRQTIKTSPVPYYAMVTDSIGYINMATFAVENCSKEVKKALIELKRQGARALVFDVRGNTGGLLNEAVSTVNFFVPKNQEIVVTKGKLKQAMQTYRTESDPLDLDMPLAVLVNEETASASEIFSGALQDLDRAVIIGNRTFGKGLVQTVRPLPYNSSVKITTSKYYIPSGRCIQAIDYSKRNVDGSIARVPDSLTNVFHTAAGREVRDGGGIRPDIEVKGEQLPNILFYLINDFVIFDYATRYVQKHPAVSSLSDFKITEEDYADFKQFVKERKFTYDRQSDAVLKNLKEIAKFEGYLNDASEEFAALEKKLTHNLDRDLDHFEKDIRGAIAAEAVKRYFYLKGSIVEQLKDDPDLNKAIEVLKNKAAYAKLLSKGTALE
ncbi:peptidase, S41 family [Bacteroidetes bacterium oral taxon 272 str. F0290]|uniref:S41 family peptidase n=1 Tax=Phocaeicola abscessus TaxID=555313 RepID=UPI0003866662|nr:S41 family peptidase [Phocaeicola abscessus]EPT33365.1 peptidase, S41 family [Bacteroidetes bacterium oral taxon 272 str. F0290]